MITLISLIFFSCKKEDITPTSGSNNLDSTSTGVLVDVDNLQQINAPQNLVFDAEFGVTVSNGMLVFRSSEEYKPKCKTEHGWSVLTEYNYGTSMRIQSYTLRRCLSKYEAIVLFKYKFNSSQEYQYFKPEDTNSHSLYLLHGY